MKRYVIILICFLITIFPISAYADGFNVDGKQIVLGGTNTYDGIEQTDRKDSEAVEQKIRLSGDYYYTYNGMTDIPDEYRDLLTEYIGDLVCNENEMSIYYNKYLLSKLYQELSETGDYSLETYLYFSESTVIFDCGKWTANENAYGYSDEWGDNITDGYEVGYIKVIAPYETELLFLDNERKIYYQVLAESGESIIKLKKGQYYLLEVNFTDISSEEPDVPYNNNLRVGYTFGCTEDDAYVIDLTPIIKKYGITEKDLTEIKAQRSGQVVPHSYFETEESQITETSQDKDHSKMLMMCLFLGGMALAWLFIKYKFDKNNDK